VNFVDGQSHIVQQAANPSAFCLVDLMGTPEAF
jgi:hypothetical protein